MTAKHDGGPAFPVEKFTAYPHGGGYIHRDEGMSLRDYFAAKAMQGWVSDPAMRSDSETIRYAAEFAYKMADAMLEARERT